MIFVSAGKFLRTPTMHGCGFRDADAELEISADAHVARTDGPQALGIEFALCEHEAEAVEQMFPQKAEAQIARP